MNAKRRLATASCRRAAVLNQKSQARPRDSDELPFTNPPL
jgi:hypothetical protein